MKTNQEIIDSGKVCNFSQMEVNGISIMCGEIYDRKEKIHFTAGRDEDGWEHVATSIGTGRKIPSWETMCKAKKVFWNDEEDVVQLHPRESSYFHGFPGKMEVLHLWRPKNGDWSLLNFSFGSERR